MKARVCAWVWTRLCFYEDLFVASVQNTGLDADGLIKGYSNGWFD